MFFFFCNSQTRGGHCSIFKLEKYFLFEKVACLCSLCASAWVTFAHFKWHMWCHTMSKLACLPCFQKHHYILFLMMLHMTANDKKFVADGFFFLPSFFLEKVHACPLFFWFFNFSPYIFYCLISSLAIL
jgi:hypothetical protein